MRTIKAANASRLNGSKSRGPKTPEGKRRSSINAQRHGLLSRGVVLDNESSENFGLLLQQHIEKFAPADDVEFSAIEEMVSSVWRLRRLWSIEKHLLDKTIDGATNHVPRTTDPLGDESDRISAAFSALAQGPELHLLGRYEARLHRMYQRALNNFLLLREMKGPDMETAPVIEPEPASAPEPSPTPLPSESAQPPVAPLAAALPPPKSAARATASASVAASLHKNPNCETNPNLRNPLPNHRAMALSAALLPWEFPA